MLVGRIFSSNNRELSSPFWRRIITVLPCYLVSGRCIQRIRGNPTACHSNNDYSGALLFFLIDQSELTLDTVADIILIAQVLYYRKFPYGRRRRSSHSPGASHLSPATPLLHPNKPPKRPPPVSTLRAGLTTFETKLRLALINTSAVFAVVVSGILGYYLSRLYSLSVPDDSPEHEEIEISILGQIFGWGCAVLYLGSRIPQVVKNFRRKSTEGLSLLFFLFACLGNITYVLSIVSLSLNPRYLLANLSWLVGSAGTLLLDALVRHIMCDC